MFTKWLKKLEDRIVGRIAARVADRLDNSPGEFLPPVVLRDHVYMTTKRGQVWRMSVDGLTMEAMFEIVRR